MRLGNSPYNVVYGILEWIYTGNILSESFDDTLQLWSLLLSSCFAVPSRVTLNLPCRDDSQLYDMKDLQNYCQKRLLILFERRSQASASGSSPQATMDYALQLFQSTEVKDTQRYRILLF